MQVLTYRVSYPTQALLAGLPACRGPCLLRPKIETKPKEIKRRTSERREGSIPPVKLRQRRRTPFGADWAQTLPTLLYFPHGGGIGKFHIHSLHLRLESQSSLTTRGWLGRNLIALQPTLKTTSQVLRRGAAAANFFGAHTLRICASICYWAGNLKPTRAAAHLSAAVQNPHSV